MAMATIEVEVRSRDIVVAIGIPRFTSGFHIKAQLRGATIPAISALPTPACLPVLKFFSAY